MNELTRCISNSVERRKASEDDGLDESDALPVVTKPLNPWASEDHMQELQCPVCHKRLVQPVCTPCGHAFCISHLYLDTDNEDIDKALESYFMQEHFRKLLNEPWAKHFPKQEIEAFLADSDFTKVRDTLCMKARLNDLVARDLYLSSARNLKELETPTSFAEVGLKRKTNWDALEVGRFVRLKPMISNPRYGMGRAKDGNVGILGRLSSDGDVWIHFPSAEGPGEPWRGLRDEIEVDEIDELRKLPPHQRFVRLKPSIKEPAYGFGFFNHGEVGLVVQFLFDGRIALELTNGSVWKGILQELELVPIAMQPDWSTKLVVELANGFKKNQMVRVKPHVEPVYGWGQLNRDEKDYEVGLVSGERKLNFESELSEELKVRLRKRGLNKPELSQVVVQFPSQDNWLADPSDLERVSDIISEIKIGRRVRLKPTVTTPMFGWAPGVTQSAVGLVKALRHDAVLLVEFGQYKWFRCPINEVELYEGPLMRPTCPRCSASLGGDLKEDRSLSTHLAKVSEITSQKAEQMITELERSVSLDGFSEFECSICSSLFSDPVTLRCGHTFCKRCLEVWLHEHPHCPVCRQKSDCSDPGQFRGLQTPETFDDVVEIFAAFEGGEDSDEEELAPGRRRLQTNWLLQRQIQRLFPKDMCVRSLETQGEYVMRLCSQGRGKYLKHLANFLRSFPEQGIQELKNNGLKICEEMPGAKATILMFCAQEGLQRPLKAVMALGANPAQICIDCERRFYPSVIQGVLGPGFYGIGLRNLPIARPCRTALYFAAANNKPKCLEALLAAQSKWKAEAVVDALAACAHRGTDECARVLLNHWPEDVDINTTNFKELNAVALAASVSREEILRILVEDNPLKHKFDINKKCQQHGRTPLMYASRLEESGPAKILLRNKASIECRDNHGDTPLIAAARYGRRAVVSLLLEHGADPNAKNSTGATPLMQAARRYLVPLKCPDNHPMEWTNYLLEKYRQGWICNGCGRKSDSKNAWRYCCRYCVYDLCIFCSEPEEWAKIDHYMCIRARQSIWTAKCHDSYQGCLEGLLEYKADPLRLSNTGSSVLHYAARSSAAPPPILRPSIISGVGGPGKWYFGFVPQANQMHVLLSLKEVQESQLWNKKDECTGATPLFMAVACGNTSAAKALLEAKSDANVEGCVDDKSLATQHAEWTPDSRLRASALTVALDQRRWHISMILLDYKADINTQIKHPSNPLLDGLTPLMVLSSRRMEGTKGERTIAPVITLRIAKRFEKIADINARNGLGATALHFAAAAGDGKMCTNLLKGKADVRCRLKYLEDDYVLLLPKVVHTQAKHIVQATLYRGEAYPLRLRHLFDRLDPFSSSPLRKIKAAHRPPCEWKAQVCLIPKSMMVTDAAIRDAVEQDLILQSTLGDWSPLHLAAIADNNSALVALLARKADMTVITGDGGHTPLHLACALGKREAIRSICEYRRSSTNNGDTSTSQAPCSLITMRDHQNNRPMDLTTQEIRFLYMFLWV